MTLVPDKSWILLGYASTPSNWISERAPLVVEEIEKIITEISTLDQKIENLLTDGMATKIGSIDVDFKNHRRRLLSHGNSLLLLLSSLVEQPIKFNKYSQTTLNKPISLLNYW
jgi:hypothetical protein